ncbi:MAG: hypothetical protein ACXWN0_03190 [Isosphaeraceae bacterium]
MERDKEEHSFAHQDGKRPRKGPLFGGARLTIEPGSDFPIGVTEPAFRISSTSPGLGRSRLSFKSGAYCRPVRSWRTRSPEVAELRALVYHLQGENHEFRQQAGHQKSRYRYNMEHINTLWLKIEPTQWFFGHCELP